MYNIKEVSGVRCEIHTLSFSYIDCKMCLSKAIWQYYTKSENLKKSSYFHPPIQI